MYYKSSRVKMEYNLQKVVGSSTMHSNSRNESYGGLPSTMIMAKFEETDMGDEEGLTDNFIRNEIMDWSSAKESKFEHEEARVGGSHRSGKLNLQYYGHRGDADPQYRPEHFDGFMGPEDRDPRGSQTDPDFKKLKAQHEARLRFIRLTPDGNDSITGGGRSEGKAMADNQKVFKLTKERLKIFDRQLDGGGTKGTRRYAHTSNIPKQILVHSYGDKLCTTETPQRKANIICKEVIRSSRAWRAETSDADYATATYTQLRRHRKTTDQNRMLWVDTDQKKTLEDNSKCFKSAGILMSNITNGRKQIMTNTGDIDLAESKIIAARKMEPFNRDLNLILRAMTQDADFATGDLTQTAKTLTPQQREHLARQTVQSHDTPAHHLLNAEKMYKACARGNTRKIKDLVITDAYVATTYDDQTAAKSAKRQIVSGAKLARVNDSDFKDASNTFNYRIKLNPNGDRRIRITSGDAVYGTGDNSQIRRPNHTNYRVSSGDTVEDMKYGDNASKERHARGLGSKYMHRFIERDAKVDEINLGN